MTDIRDEYITLLAQHGVLSPNYRTIKLKARLQKAFGYHSGDQSIDVMQKLYFLTVYQKVIMLKKQCEMTTMSEDTAPTTFHYSELFHTAKTLQTQLKKVKSQMSDPT